jgi:hypothetical protein
VQFVAPRAPLAADFDARKRSELEQPHRLPFSQPDFFANRPATPDEIEATLTAAPKTKSSFFCNRTREACGQLAKAVIFVR